MSENNDKTDTKAIDGALTGLKIATWPNRQVDMAENDATELLVQNGTQILDTAGTVAKKTAKVSKPLLLKAVDNAYMRNLQHSYALPLLRKILEQVTNMNVEYIFAILKKLDIDLESKDGKVLKILTVKNQQRVDILAKIIITVLEEYMSDPEKRKKLEELRDLLIQFIGESSKTLAITLGETSGVLNENLEQVKPVAKNFLFSGIGTVIEVLTAAIFSIPVIAPLQLPYKLLKAVTLNIPKFLDLVDAVGDGASSVGKLVSARNKDLCKSMQPALASQDKLRDINKQISDIINKVEPSNPVFTNTHMYDETDKIKEEEEKKKQQQKQKPKKKGLLDKIDDNVDIGGDFFDGDMFGGGNKTLTCEDHKKLNKILNSFNL